MVRRLLAALERDVPPATHELALLAGLAADGAPELLAAAGRKARAARGDRVTFSPNVFLPVTRLCRNACGYCTFRRPPAHAEAATLAPGEVLDLLDRAAASGCTEALLCLGDAPEGTVPAYRALLARWGHPDTVSYLAWIAGRALERGILPHTNAGVLDERAYARLHPCNASLGLMLESTAERLCAPGGPHAAAPDKLPAVRLAAIEAAGRVGAAFTTGLLVGIGESPHERLETLLAIRRLHARWGHVQEVIVQPFQPHPGTPMARHAPPRPAELLGTVALARLLLPREVSIQVPPNLAGGATAALVAAGADDLGGISPLTRDHINPGHPWPARDRLATTLGEAGFRLLPRLPVHPGFRERVAPALRPLAEAMAGALC